MSLVLAGLFTSSIELSGHGRLALVLPICLAIAVVYKTIRCESVRDVPKAAFPLWVTIVVGMYAIGLALWGAFSLMV